MALINFNNLRAYLGKRKHSSVDLFVWVGSKLTSGKHTPPLNQAVKMRGIKLGRRASVIGIKMKMSDWRKSKGRADGCGVEVVKDRFMSNGEVVCQGSSFCLSMRRRTSVSFNLFGHWVNKSHLSKHFFPKWIQTADVNARKHART